MQRGSWNKASLLEYLKSCNVKGLRVEIIAQKAEEDRKNEVFNLSAIESHIWKWLSCFEKYKFPDVPLLGLGHGMITDVMFLIHQIFAHHNKMISFVNLANIIFDDIRTFRLDYCKLKSLPKATWVGEHCMGYMRIMCYLYESYLLNNELGPIDKTKDTVTNLKCMLNAFQSLISVLMSMRKVSTKSIAKHMKHSMSS